MPDRHRFCHALPAALLGLAWACAAPAPALAEAAPAPAPAENTGSLPDAQVVMDIPANVSSADVDRVLAFVARHRKWSIEERGPGRIELSLRHREFDAHLILTYDATRLTILSRSTTLDGKPAVPTRWITAFVKDVRYEFAAKRP